MNGWRCGALRNLHHSIDQQTTDFANVLNYAYDNTRDAGKRVQRLYSGESISTTRARTIRMSAVIAASQR